VQCIWVVTRPLAKATCHCCLSWYEIIPIGWEIHTWECTKQLNKDKWFIRVYKHAHCGESTQRIQYISSPKWDPKFDVIGTRYLTNGVLVYQRTHHFLQCHLVGVNGVLSSEDTNKHGRNQTLNKLAHHLWRGTVGTGIYSALISFYTNHNNYWKGAWFS